MRDRAIGREKFVNPPPGAAFGSCHLPRALFFSAIMLLLAATTLEKLQAVPVKVWLNIGLAILIFIAAIIIIRKAAEMNKVLLSVIIFVIITSVGFNWIYARNEPKFLTPLIEPLAKFFPTAGKKADKEKHITP